MHIFFSIKKVFTCFANSKWVNSHGLIIESDSLNAVSWVNAPSTTPWKLKKLCAFIKFLKSSLKAWKIVHIHRESNEYADMLAKVGIHIRNSMIVVPN
ncbi:hypothetical protein REPUB_Repub19eG0107600 [Reevesia pubescens]